MRFNVVVNLNHEVNCFFEGCCLTRVAFSGIREVELHQWIEYLDKVNRGWGNVWTMGTPYETLRAVSAHG